MRRDRALRVALVVGALLSLGATPGDIGGCGQPAEDLDPVLFFDSLDSTDCQRCQECGIATATCADACAGRGIPTSFAEGCAPLAHDGDACIRRLESASCDEYAAFVADDEQGRAVPIAARPRPSECNFCPPP